MFVLLGLWKSLEIILHLPLADVVQCNECIKEHLLYRLREKQYAEEYEALTTKIDHHQVTCQLTILKMSKITTNQPLVEMHLKLFKVTYHI